MMQTVYFRIKSYISSNFTNKPNLNYYESQNLFCGHANGRIHVAASFLFKQHARECEK